MSGSSTAPRVQKPYIISTTFAAPLDDRLVISSVSNIDAELPLPLRFRGLMVFVEDQSTYYYFKDGITNTDFIKFNVGDSGAINVIASTLIGDTEIVHGIGTKDISVNVYENEPSQSPLDVQWVIGKLDTTGLTEEEAEAYRKNIITLSPDIDGKNVLIKITTL